jgi:hypothetical protein
LTPIGTPIAVGTSMPNPGAMELSADGAALFILPSPQPSPAGLMYGYALNATTGAPTPMAGSPFTLTASAFRLHPHPSLPVLYVGGSNSVAAYGIGATLTPLAGSPYSIGGSVLGMVLDPGARFLYAGAGSSGLTIYEVRSGGALEPMAGGNLPTPFAPATLVADPGGRYLFISDFTSGNIQPIAVNTRTGRLTLVQGSAFNGGRGINNLAISR